MLTSGLPYSEKTVHQLRQLLAEFTLPKFYEVFGIQHVKCAPISAFPHFRPGERSGLMASTAGPNNSSHVGAGGGVVGGSTALNIPPLTGSIGAIVSNLHHSQGSSSSISSNCSGGTCTSMSIDGGGGSGGVDLLSGKKDTSLRTSELKKPESNPANSHPVLIMIGDNCDEGSVCQRMTSSIETPQRTRQIINDSADNCGRNPYSQQQQQQQPQQQNPHQQQHTRTTDMFHVNSSSRMNSAYSDNYSFRFNQTPQYVPHIFNPYANIPAYLTAHNASQLSVPSIDGLDKPERLSLSSLEFLTDTLLEIMSLVIKEVPKFTHWLDQWTQLARK
ncbi:unnamed protein product [Trichobilharzia regenti]|nr:unnamed protein product [Trichobilharzia regenti]